MLTIEVQKAGFINKGAELMLLSIVDTLRKRYPDIKLVMETTPDNGEQPYSKLLPLGIFPKAHLNLKGVDVSPLLELIPSKIQQRFGLVPNIEIDILIDAAGFAYSSQWGDIHVEKLLKKIKIMKKNNTSIILMPQAFGPFDSESIRNSMRSVLDLSDIIFARDLISYSSLKELSPNASNIYKFPDFTNLFKPTIPEYFDYDIHQVCVVPNKRMIDKRSDDKYLYINLMSKIVKYILSIGLNPFILVHEDNDISLAREIINDMPDVSVIVENNPAFIKGIISKSKALVGSRFHSLVSGLSQSVPTVGTGWSHKYQELFTDYDFKEGLISLDISDEDLYALLDKICTHPSSDALRNQLSIKSAEQKDLSTKTWDIIFNFIDTKAQFT